MRARRYLPYLLAAALLLSGGWDLPKILRSFRVADVSNDPVTEWDAHMRMLASALPSDVSSVGYLEVDYLGQPSQGQNLTELILTQYGLAPTVVYTGADHDWIVGNFGKTLTPQEVLKILDHKLGSAGIQYFGSGIYLIHRASR